MAITSATPGIPKLIEINVTSGLAGQPLTIRNRDNGDEVHQTLLVAGKALFDVQNFTNNYTEGDVIEFSVSGEKNGSNTVTTEEDVPESVTISTSTVNDAARGI